MHKRPDQSDSEFVVAGEATQQAGSGDVELDDIDQTISAARRPASDATVKKATYGLMRLQSKRRARVMVRRMLMLSLVVGSLAGIWYFFGDRIPTDQIQDRWDSITSRLFPGDSEAAP